MPDRRGADLLDVVGDEGVGETGAGALLPPITDHTRARSLESSSSTPASCSMTSGPLRPRRPWRVITRSEHSPAAMPMPPKHPTIPRRRRRPACTGAGARSRRGCRRWQACRGWPPAGGCRRFRGGSRRTVVAVLPVSGPSSRLPASLAPLTSPMPPPWNFASKATTTARSPPIVPRATTAPSSLCGTIACGARRGLDIGRRGPQFAEGALVEDGAGPFPRGQFGERVGRRRPGARSCVLISRLHCLRQAEYDGAGSGAEVVDLDLGGERRCGRRSAPGPPPRCRTRRRWCAGRP